MSEKERQEQQNQEVQPDDNIDDITYENQQKKVQVFSSQDVNIEDFEFPDDLTALDAVVKRAQKVVSFEHPTHPNKKINFLCESLSPADRALVDSTILPKEKLRKIFKEVVGKESPTSAELASPEYIEKLQQKFMQSDETADILSDNLEDASQREFDRKCKVVLLGVKKPTGLTIDRIKGWNEEVIETLYMVIEEELASVDAIWGFPEVGKNY